MCCFVGLYVGTICVAEQVHCLPLLVLLTWNRTLYEDVFPVVLFCMSLPQSQLSSAKGLPPVTLHINVTSSPVSSGLRGDCVTTNSAVGGSKKSLKMLLFLSILYMSTQYT